MYRSLFPSDLFAELDRLQREVHGVFDASPSIRGLGRGGYPALNVGATPSSIELYAFAPGLEPASIDVDLDRGVLTIAGERKTREASSDADEQRLSRHVEERFNGRFRRVVSLPDDIDPDGVQAQYRDGILHVTVKRRESAQPKRIEIH